MVGAAPAIEEKDRIPDISAAPPPLHSPEKDLSAMIEMELSGILSDSDDSPGSPTESVNEFEVCAESDRQESLEGSEDYADNIACTPPSVSGNETPRKQLDFSMELRLFIFYHCRAGDQALRLCIESNSGKVAIILRQLFDSINMASEYHQQVHKICEYEEEAVCNQLVLWVERQISGFLSSSAGRGVATKQLFSLPQADFICSVSLSILSYRPKVLHSKRRKAPTGVQKYVSFSSSQCLSRFQERTLAFVRVKCRPEFFHLGVLLASESLRDSLFPKCIEESENNSAVEDMHSEGSPMESLSSESSTNYDKDDICNLTSGILTMILFRAIIMVLMQFSLFVWPCMILA
jgi:hypothetical protein